MDRMIDQFVNDRFFNDLADKVYLIKVEVVNNLGKLERAYTRDGEIVKKVIRPLTAMQRQQYSVDADVMLNLTNKLDFYGSNNTTDIIEWKNKYYKVVDEYDRENNNGYAYRYFLKYLNKDELINGELSN